MIRVTDLTKSSGSQELFTDIAFTLGKGEELPGRVRIFVHRGDAVAAGVAARYRYFVEGR